MEALLFILLFPRLESLLSDPVPGLWQERQAASSLECVRMSQAEAHALHPARVPEPSPRGTTAQTDALICTRLLMEEGERPERDEAILSTLSRTVDDLTEVAAAHVPAGFTWYVDAFYPDPSVTAKIAVATRTTLAEKGRRVSDRAPVLPAGDSVVLGRLSPKEAYPLACARYFEQKVLTENEAFLGLMLVDARETQLHAGVCLDGKWRWLQ